MTAWAGDAILKLLHPLMPFITEELWQRTAQRGMKRDRLLTLAKWPHLSDLETLIAPSEPNMDVVVDTVSEVRSMRKMFNVPAKDTLRIHLTNFDAANTAALTANVSSVSRLANSEVRILDLTGLAVAVDRPPAAQTAPPVATSNRFTVRSPIKEGVVNIEMPASFDPSLEKARLEKEMTRVKSDIARIDAKLANADFVARAPEDVVEGEREKREEAEARRAKIDEALTRLKGAA